MGGELEGARRAVQTELRGSALPAKPRITAARYGVYGGGAAVTETADPESAGSWYGDYGDAAAATENADSKSAGAAQGCKKGVAGLQSIPEMSESRDGGGRRGEPCTT